jgi:S-adenosylmethionine hydrolase
MYQRIANETILQCKNVRAKKCLLPRNHLKERQYEYTMLQPHPRPVIALLTDFGTGEGDIGVMKGVIAGITPDAHIIDITHDVAPQNIASGAWILASAYRYFPNNTAFVCVVDPGVGSNRGAIAVHAGDWFFVGPDNGLFSYILSEQAGHAAVLLSNPAYHLPHVSSTFHGRDIFAPVGAYLARGLTSTFHELGTPVDPTSLQRLNVTLATRQGMNVDAHIVHIDNFGNLITGIPLTLVPDLFTATKIRLVLSKDGVVIEQRRRFFADGPNDGQPFMYGDSSGYAGIAIRDGNAAQTLGIGVGANIALTVIEK